MSGIFICDASNGLGSTLAQMDRIFVDWTMRAARGECGWVCADCSVSFPEGMPDACMHGHESCTSIIKRDKAEAAQIQPLKGEQA